VTAPEYELLVIGSGPAGQRAAIQAAKLRKRVALVERRRHLGGVSVNTGTIPSKTIREAVMYLTGLSQRGIYGQDYRLKEEIRIEDLAVRTRQVVERERSVIPTSSCGTTSPSSTATHASPARPRWSSSTTPAPSAASGPTR